MPTRGEIEKQLERILYSQTFAKATTLTALLNRLVQDELDGRSIDEYTLGKDVFGKPENWIPMHEATVRQGLANLRKRLAQYYNAEGGDDPVLIRFRTRGYRPTFVTNEGAAAATHYRRAIERFDRTFPDISRKSTLAVRRDLKASIKANPAYAPAHAKLAEVMLIYCMCDESYYFPSRQSVAAAEEAARTALALDDKSWLAHVVMAAIHACRFEWDQAGKAFEAARSIAPEETANHIWYPAYLAAVGKSEEARRALDDLLRNSLRDEFKVLIHALFLYVRRDFDGAYEWLSQEAAELDFVKDPNAYLCGDEILECDSWLVALLLACVALGKRSHAAWQYAEKAAKDSRLDAFVGLTVPCYSCTAAFGYGKFKAHAARKLALLERHAQHCGPLNLALAYMGAGKPATAVRYLKRACDESHPLMAWLHLWPVFDPLRGHPAFKKLIERMKLPTG